MPPQARIQNRNCRRHDRPISLLRGGRRSSACRHGRSHRRLRCAVLSFPHRRNRMYTPASGCSKAHPWNLPGCAVHSRLPGCLRLPRRPRPEIGWSPIQSPPGAQLPHWFMFLLNPLLYLFRWHEDTFDIPSKATHLAETQLYCNQALSAENFALGLQFHPEVTAEGPGALVCRACLRTQHQADQRLGTPRRPAPQFWNGWLDSLFG